MLTKMRFELARWVATRAPGKATTTELAALATFHATPQAWHGGIADGDGGGDGDGEGDGDGDGGGDGDGDGHGGNGNSKATREWQSMNLQTLPFYTEFCFIGHSDSLAEGRSMYN